MAAAALIPSFAAAQQTCEQQHSNRVAGTVVGAGAGALVGSAVAGRSDRTAGALIGGIGGAIVGNQLAKPNADCAHAYGFYDQNGLWHANGVDRANARGYYSRDGRWVDGAPHGYYDAQNRWIATDTTPAASGYYDAKGRWAPASASSYYDADGRLIAGAASGYNAPGGRWIEGPATGRYDRDGHWISGEAAGHRDAAGLWVADAQPGYYDASGRWRAGAARGYYDTGGRWIATAPAVGNRGSDAAYETRTNWADAPRDVGARMSWLDRRIRRGLDGGMLSHDEGLRALRSLTSIRRQETRMDHRRGRLNPRDEGIIQARLDDLSNSLRWSNHDRPRMN
jgi:hypothetical protein